jgi:protein-S-isoprenylcysteine O-methyltransferase Ste14
VRHPIYLGWFLMVWGAPEMTGTRLVFAAASCVYLLLAIIFEERDLHRTFGTAYQRYARRVRWKVLPGVH